MKSKKFKCMIFDSIINEIISRESFDNSKDAHKWILKELSGWRQGNDQIRMYQMEQEKDLFIFEIICEDGELVDFKGLIKELTTIN